jgi:hypothetical protein
MPKRISKDARPKDINQAAFQMVRLSTDQPDIDIPPVGPNSSTKSEISRVMAEMGRKGGLIGGKRRLETMSENKRSRIASNAAKVRWAKAKKTKSSKKGA